jgi:hypothetical protein
MGVVSAWTESGNFFKQVHVRSRAQLGFLPYWRSLTKVAVDILSFVEGGKVDIKVKSKKQISKSMDEFTCHRALFKGRRLLVQSRQCKISRLFGSRPDIYADHQQWKLQDIIAAAHALHPTTLSSPSDPRRRVRSRSSIVPI